MGVKNIYLDKYIKYITKISHISLKLSNEFICILLGVYQFTYEYHNISFWAKKKPILEYSLESILERAKIYANKFSPIVMGAALQEIERIFWLISVFIWHCQFFYHTVGFEGSVFLYSEFLFRYEQNVFLWVALQSFRSYFYLYIIDNSLGKSYFDEFIQILFPLEIW